MVVVVATFIVWYQLRFGLCLRANGNSDGYLLPTSLGVAIPLVVAISTTASATHGLLLKNRTAFENERKLTTIIFDKKGTLTKGSHEVQKVISQSSSYTNDDILKYVAAVQQQSEHNFAKVC